MSSLTIIQVGKRNAFSFSGERDELVKCISNAASQNEMLAEVILMAAADLDISNLTISKNMPLSELQQFTEVAN